MPEITMFFLFLHHWYKHGFWPALTFLLLIAIPKILLIIEPFLPSMLAVASTMPSYKFYLSYLHL